DRRHHHPGRAEPALQAVLLVEAVLDRVQLAVLLESLHGPQAAAVRLHREHGARLHRTAVEDDRARAAAGGVAADVRAGHADVLAQEVDKERARLDLRFLLLAIHGEGDLIDRLYH